MNQNLIKCFLSPSKGSTFKVYYDSLGRAVSKFVPADDLIVPYSANIRRCRAVIHVVKFLKTIKNNKCRIYRDKIREPPVTENQLQDKKLELEGISKDGQEDQYTLYEVHTNLDLEGYEDMGGDGEPTGIKLPYVVTVAQAGKKFYLLEETTTQDPKRKRQTTSCSLNFYLEQDSMVSV